MPATTTEEYALQQKIAANQAIANSLMQRGNTLGNPQQQVINGRLMQNSPIQAIASLLSTAGGGSVMRDAERQQSRLNDMQMQGKTQFMAKALAAGGNQDQLRQLAFDPYAPEGLQKGLFENMFKEPKAYAPARWKTQEDDGGVRYDVYHDTGSGEDVTTRVRATDTDWKQAVAEQNANTNADRAADSARLTQQAQDAKAEALADKLGLAERKDKVLTLAVSDSVDDEIKKVDNLLSDANKKGFDRNFGLPGAIPFTWHGGAAANVKPLLKQLNSGAILTAIKDIRNSSKTGSTAMGPLTGPEEEIMGTSLLALGTTEDSDTARLALEDYKKALLKIKERAHGGYNVIYGGVKAAGGTAMPTNQVPVAAEPASSRFSHVEVVP